MRHLLSPLAETMAQCHEEARVQEIVLGPNGDSFSIVTEKGPDGGERLSLPVAELPRLMVALLRAGEMLERPLTFPVMKGSVALWGDAFVFTVTLVDGAAMTFELDRASAGGLLETLTTAFHCSPPSPTH